MYHRLNKQVNAEATCLTCLERFPTVSQLETSSLNSGVSLYFLVYTEEFQDITLS
jgi:hypothetical protein